MKLTSTSGLPIREAIRLIAAIILIFPFCLSSVKAETLEARIEHKEQLEPVPPGLMKGAKFDQASLPPAKPGNIWIPIPNWLAGTWQFKNETVTHMHVFDETKYPPTPFVLKNEFQKVYGYQKDKTGQVWDYLKAPYAYTCKLNDGYLGYNRIELLEVLQNDPEEHLRHLIGPDAVVDPESQTILLTNQKECFNRLKQFGDDVIVIQGSTKVFDMDGKPKVLKISNMAGTRVKPFEPVDEKDGDNLKQLFADYLKS